VGAVKQSIYKVRQADPSLFITKWERVGRGGSDRLNRLNHNVRSRGEVLSLTNTGFEKSMDREVGEISYDDTHRLVQGNYLEEAPLPSECHIIENRAEYGGDAEIKHIINVIRELVRTGADYRDIVILTRNTRDNENYRRLL